jgi:lipopolysaccharide transport system ATP-binding protein
MSEIALKVEGIGKRYRIGADQGVGKLRYKSLRDSLGGIARKPLLALRDIAVREAMNESNSFWALQDINFEVKRGEVVGIIGRNGAGKSTLLKILSRITKPTVGHVSLYGRVGSLLEVGTGFHPELTGRENIFLNGAILGMTRADVNQKFDEIVAFSEIEKFLDTSVKHYSSGMYMRLAFAVAAHLEPEILIVDEVLAVGDAEFQKKCLGKMGDVARGGRTVLFVSHNMEAVSRLCSEAILLSAGNVTDSGKDIHSIVRRYLCSEEAGGAAAAWYNSGSEFENPWFKPISFYLANAQGERIVGPVPNFDDVLLVVEADCSEIDPALTVGYSILNETGELLYRSYQTDTCPELWPRLHVGRLRLRTKLPKRLFNEGAYRIELVGGLHFRHWIFEPGASAPSISLVIQGGLSDSPLWLGRRPGLLAPVMEWSIYD